MRAGPESASVNGTYSVSGKSYEIESCPTSASTQVYEVNSVCITEVRFDKEGTAEIWVKICVKAARHELPQIENLSARFRRGAR